MTLSEFIEQSCIVKKEDGTNIVFVDGKNKQGAINDCIGTTEFEIKEDAYNYYMELENEIKKGKK